MTKAYYFMDRDKLRAKSGQLTAKIEHMHESYFLFVDLLKSINLATLYEEDAITLVTTTTWKNLFKQKTVGFKIDYLFQADYSFDPEEYKYSVKYNYLSIYLTTILAKIEADYSITFSGDLLSDADYLEMRIPLVTSNLKVDYMTPNIYVDGIVIHDSMTAWDLIKSILQLFGAVFKINGIDLELQKFDDLDITTPIDWTGKLVSKVKKFSIPDTGQKNYIKYAVAENVDKLYHAGIIDCNNENINFEKDLATMKFKVFELRDVFEFYTNASAEPIWAIQLPALKNTPSTPSTVLPVEISGVSDLQIVVDSVEYLGQP